MKKGFTLLEILVVIGVLSVIGVIILTIFTRTLRGNNKAQIIGVIKQNGQSVLENMDKTIRGADNVVCVTSDNLVVVKNGIYTRYRFIPPTTTNNGLIQQDSPVKQFVSEIEETDSQFVDRICGAAAQVYVSPVVLTDTNTQTGVSINCFATNNLPDCTNNPVFKRDKSPGFKDQVTVKFSIKSEASAALVGQIDPVNFQTTIQLRNKR